MMVDSIQEIFNENGILVFQPTNNITFVHLIALRKNIKEQLADDARFIVVYPHINVHYMRPGDSIDSAIKSGN